MHPTPDGCEINGYVSASNKCLRGVVGVTINPWATRVEAASIAHTNVMRSKASGCTFEFAWHAPASQRSWLAYCLPVSQVADAR